MRAALLLCCVLAGPVLAQQAPKAGQLSATCEHKKLESWQLENGQIQLDISALAPFEPLVWIELQTGALPLGTVIVVSNPGTDWQQRLVAFGARSDVSSISYQLAVPRGTAETILNVLVQVGQSDSETMRPATPSEVLGITLLPS